MWRPMLGSYLHKVENALDIVAVDADSDGLGKFGFNNAPVSRNALAKRFSTLLYEHRYANAAQHIYQFDEYPHGNDAGHADHLHITCMSQRLLEPCDLAGYRAAGDPESPFPPPFSLEIEGMPRPWLVR